MEFSHVATFTPSFAMERCAYDPPGATITPVCGFGPAARKTVIDGISASEVPVAPGAGPFHRGITSIAIGGADCALVFSAAPKKPLHAIIAQINSDTNVRGEIFGFIASAFPSKELSHALARFTRLIFRFKFCNTPSRLPMKRINLKELQIYLSSALRLLHFLKQSGVLGVNLIPPGIEDDRALEFFQSFFAILRNSR
jgi:hypothetical protein